MDRCSGKTVDAGAIHGLHGSGEATSGRGEACDDRITSDRRGDDGSGRRGGHVTPGPAEAQALKADSEPRPAAKAAEDAQGVPRVSLLRLELVKPQPPPGAAPAGITSARVGSGSRAYPKPGTSLTVLVEVAGSIDLTASSARTAGSRSSATIRTPTCSRTNHRAKAMPCPAEPGRRPHPPPQAPQSRLHGGRRPRRPSRDGYRPRASSSCQRRDQDPARGEPGREVRPW